MRHPDPYLELFVLETINDAQERGSEWVRERIRQLRTTGSRAIFSPRDYPAAPAPPLSSVAEQPAPNFRIAASATIGEAVVEAVREAGRFITSRYVVELLRAHPSIASEPDERIKRRKVSQALWTRKGGDLVSVDWKGGTVWGMKDWAVNGVPDDDHKITDDDEHYPGQ